METITQERLAEKVGQVRWHGNYFSMLCPFHDDREPSLLVYKDGAYCMGCRKNFTLRQLWIKLDRRPTFAQRKLPDEQRPFSWAFVPPPEELAEEAHGLLLDYPAQGYYLRQRGVESRIAPNRIGWWEGYYTFPGYTADYEFSGLVVRSSEEVEKRTGNRYLTPPSQNPFLYVPDWQRIKRAQTVFVTYGIFDALFIATLGFAVCTPSNGQSHDALLFEPIRKKLVILPDNKPEEINTANLLASQLGWRGEMFVLPYENDVNDPADFHKSEWHTRTLIAHLARF